MVDIFSASFLVALLQIILIDILLGGDNAVVIALACRRLPPDKRRQGILWGVAGAIGLRVVLIFFALQLLAVPWLKVAGALLLFWIGIKLLQPEDGGHGEVAAPATLAGAIKTIVVADAVMSLDNVIAVAGAANGSLALVVFGILVSIPIVVWGSQFVLKMMDRFPMVITGGGALLGWIGGGMIVGDPALPPDLFAAVPYAKYLASALGAVLVVAAGRLLARRSRQAAECPGEEPAEPAPETV
ncbi:TerC family protein [Thauera sinica]|uniref:TerC family protein n=1 Tax=Thauera sinica TaxID=2665146 RepID=A0ABW1AVA5_9RHOO|nr:TerC family protein [Thauera sp. K11]